MKQNFGVLPMGAEAFLYTISCGPLTARFTDLGAALVQLWVPDRYGKSEDVVLGYDCAADYLVGDACLGATIGRNANRVKNACFVLHGKTYALEPNEGTTNLHSGTNGFHRRIWSVLTHTENAITFGIHSPHMDQGFPGNAMVRVTYTLTQDALQIRYWAISDQDTVFNMTNHAYFNLAGHQHPQQAMEQVLSMPARFFNPDDAANIPTGELRTVAGTPMDFRLPKPLGQDIGADYEPLHLQGGYDHNFEVFCNPCATLTHPGSGRRMCVITDCPGVQLYTGNFTDTTGKGGVYYCKRSGVCLETQYYPDSVHHPAWPQPFIKAGECYESETTYRFSW